MQDLTDSQRAMLSEASRSINFKYIYSVWGCTRLHLPIYTLLKLHARAHSRLHGALPYTEPHDMPQAG